MSGIGGIIGGALAAGIAGGAEGMSEGIRSDIKQENRLEEIQAMRDADLMKAKAIAQFTNQLSVDTANQQRQAMTSRINDAQTGIINQNMNKKYAGSDAAVNAANSGQTDAPLTDDQQAVIDQAKNADRDALKNSSDTYVKAAMQTGDIDPKTIAGLTSKADIAQLKSENYADRTAMMEKLGNIRADAMRDSMQLRLDAAHEKAVNGKIDTATGRMLITSEDANIKATTSQINMLNQQLQFARKENKPGILAQIDSLKDDIQTSKATKNSYMKGMGFPTSDDLPANDTKPSSASASDPLGLFKK